MNNEEKYMKRCLDLAALAGRQAAPNPMVGCVLVYRDRIIGEGYHRQYGQAHAEVNAIAAVKDADRQKIPEATLYVNLEPCCFQGKTPACTELILREGIKKVVAGSHDPHPKVSGGGLANLRQHGVEVRENILKEESQFLNRRYFNFHRQQRPYIILKWAQTKDGYFAPVHPSQHWITGTPARKAVHRWRSEEMAIMAGYNTLLIDDPQLNDRYWNGTPPIRMTIDRNGDLPSHLHFFDHSQPTWIFGKKRASANSDIQYIPIQSHRSELPQIMEYLYEKKILSLLVEGGRKLLDEFIGNALWDEARIFHSPDYWGDGIEAPKISGNMLSEEFLGNDRLVIILR